jgi:hypothetical protein
MSDDCKSSFAETDENSDDLRQRRKMRDSVVDRNTSGERNALQSYFLSKEDRKKHMTL